MLLKKKKPWAVTFPDCFSINTDVVLEAFRRFGNGLSIIPQTPTRRSVMKRVIRIVITAARSDLYWVRGTTLTHARTHTQLWGCMGECECIAAKLHLDQFQTSKQVGPLSPVTQPTFYPHLTPPPRVKKSQASQPRRATDLQKTVVGKE